MPGRVLSRASKGYRGEDNTDAKDAAVIADQARICRDLQPLRPMMKGARDQGPHRSSPRPRRRPARLINRLHTHLTSTFPSLSRALDLTNNGPLIL
ncbi:transposase [Streptomyces sp. 11x1]|uniref:IS110 family transposase n=1 Tax=Streptomyces sp. 11x1 TaxID=3038642 RepID=UPI0037DA5CE5